MGSGSVKWLATGLIVLLSVGAGTPADREAAEGKITSLIEQLGDPTFAKREAASKELAELDETVLPIVRNAAESNPDAEIRGRASQAIRDIMRGNAASK